MCFSRKRAPGEKQRHRSHPSNGNGSKFKTQGTTDFGLSLVLTIEILEDSILTQTHLEVTLGFITLMARVYGIHIYIHTYIYIFIYLFKIYVVLLCFTQWLDSSPNHINPHRKKHLARAFVGVFTWNGRISPWVTDQTWWTNKSKTIGMT